MLLVTPGPAVLYIVARSLEQGRPAGIVSVAGVAVGSIIHLTVVSLGFAALVASSATAFNLLKYLGAAYLIYLGIKSIATGKKVEERKRNGGQRLGRVFIQAVIVQVCNPKTALFFAAFLPQFVAPLKGPAGAQILFLGFTLIIMGFVSDGLYALLAGGARRFLRPGRTRLPGYVSGGVYIGLGLLAAFSSAHRK